MSAYIVETNEIATLAASIALVLGDNISPNYFDTASQCADILHSENVISWNYRYKDNTAPEAINITAEHIETAKNWTLAEQFEAINCLVYQSCEHPEYKDSNAFKILARYRSECIAPTSSHDLPHNTGALIG